MTYRDQLRVALRGFDFTRFPIPLVLSIDAAADHGPDVYRLTVYSLLRDREAGPALVREKQEIAKLQDEFMQYSTGELSRPLDEDVLSRLLLAGRDLDLLRTDLNMLFRASGSLEEDVVRLKYCVGELVETFLVHELRESMLFLGTRFRDPHASLRQYPGVCAGCGGSLASLGQK